MATDVSPFSFWNHEIPKVKRKGNVPQCVPGHAGLAVVQSGRRPGSGLSGKFDLKYTGHGAREMAQSLKCLPHELEN